MSPYLAPVNASELPAGVLDFGDSAGVYRYYTIDAVSGRCEVFPVFTYVNPDVGIKVGLALTVISFTYIWSTFALYFMRRHHSYLAKRASIPLLHMTCMGGSFMTLVAIQETIYPQNWPCLTNLIFFLIIPCWISPLAIRFMAAVNRVQFFEHAGQASIVDLDEIMARMKQGNPFTNFVAALRLLFSGKKLSPLEKTIIRGIFLGQFVADLIILPFILLILILIANTPAYQHNCYGCFGNPYNLIFLISTLIIVISSILVVFVYRNAIDPLGELFEIKKCLLICGLFAGSGQILSALPFGQREYKIGFTFEYITLIGYLVMHFEMIVLPVLRTMKHLDPDAAGLDAVLNDPAHKAEYADFLRKEMSYENIKFIDEVAHFKADYPHDAPASRVTKAHRLLNSMVVDGALLQVNLPDAMRTCLEKLIPKDATDVEQNVFDEAVMEIRHLMERDSFPRFKAHIKRTRGQDSFKPRRTSKQSVRSLDLSTRGSQNTQDA